MVTSSSLEQADGAARRDKVHEAEHENPENRHGAAFEISSATVGMNWMNSARTARRIWTPAADHDADSRMMDRKMLKLSAPRTAPDRSSAPATPVYIAETPNAADLYRGCGSPSLRRRCAGRGWRSAPADGRAAGSTRAKHQTATAR